LNRNYYTVRKEEEEIKNNKLAILIKLVKKGPLINKTKRIFIILG